MVELGWSNGARVRFAEDRPDKDPRSREVIMQAVRGLFMEKWLCWSSMGVAGLLLLLFLLDLFVGFPFNRISVTVDIMAILACGLVLYLAYDAFRDLR
jgi:hypothetical protein